MIRRYLIVTLFLIFFVIDNDIYAEVKIPTFPIRPFSSLKNSGREIVPLKEVKRIIPCMKEKKREPELFPWECLRSCKQKDIVPLVFSITNRKFPITTQERIKKDIDLEEKMVDLEILHKRVSYIVRKSEIDPAKEELRKAQVFTRLAKDAETHQSALNYIERARELIDSALKITTLRVIQ